MPITSNPGGDCGRPACRGHLSADAVFKSSTVILDPWVDGLITQGESQGEDLLEWDAENSPGFQLQGVSGPRSRDSHPGGKGVSRSWKRTTGGFLEAYDREACGQLRPRSFCSQGSVVNCSTLFWKLLWGNSLKAKRSPWHSTEGGSHGIVH